VSQPQFFKFFETRIQNPSIFQQIFFNRFNQKRFINVHPDCLIIYEYGMKLTRLYKKYKPTYKDGLFDFIRHMVYLCTSFYWMYVLKNSVYCVIPVLVTGLLQVKTFIIFHDCGHMSYTPNKTLNYVIGIISGILIATPFSWKLGHAVHHVTNGNRENKYEHHANETVFHTVQQYKNMSYPRRKIYAFVRHPLIFFTIIPFVKFTIGYRFHALRFRKRKTLGKINPVFIIADQIINNVGFISLYYWTYIQGIFIHFTAVATLATSIGIMLFHCQHTFNPSYAGDNNSWNNKDSSVIGSSFIKIPWFLKYFTGHIEYHHAHHLNSKIPHYFLGDFHDDVVMYTDLFDNVPTMTLMDCLSNLKYTLYDDKLGKYVTFPSTYE